MKPLRRADYVIAAVVFVGSLALFLRTTGMGFTRDEGFYFHAASLYIGWFEDLWRNLFAGNLGESFTRENIDQHWSYNPEHPVVMKASFALSHKFFHEILGWMSPSTAWRFPTMITASFLLSGLYLFGRQLAGAWAGIVAVFALLLQPRFFFHAHMACFDVAITAASFWVIYAYWKSFDSRRWAVATGVFFGLALSIKLNAFFLPLILVGHWVILNWREFRLHLRPKTLGGPDDRRGPSFEIPPIPLAFWSMAILGPLLFYALWPRHWFETFQRIRWYMNFHLEHEHYFVNYFGQNLQVPPFPISYPFGMTLFTVPATILLAGLLGSLWYFFDTGQHRRIQSVIRDLRARRLPLPTENADPRGTGWLLVINLIFPIALIAMPNTPIFGGTKHWMPAMPFLALFAGFAVAAAAGAIAPVIVQLLPRWHRLAIAALPLVLTLAVAVPAGVATHQNHPFGTAYYNELIGSYRGAADHRMVRKFWGHSSRQALPFLNEDAPEGASVWIHKILRTAWQVYQEEELARPDLRATSQRASDYALYHQQKAFVFVLLPLWEEYGTMAPVHVVEIQGVPLVSVYRRPAPGELKYPDVWR